MKEFSETLGKAGQTVFPAMYNNDGDPISYIEQMAKAYNAGQKGTVTPGEWEQVTKPSLVATGGANTEQIQAAYIAGQADAGNVLAKNETPMHNEITKGELTNEQKDALRPRSNGFLSHGGRGRPSLLIGWNIQKMVIPPSL